MRAVLTSLFLRSGRALIIMLLVVLSVQFMFSLLPGSAAEAILGENATPEAVEALNRELGLDRPFWEQYFSWIINALQGDLGTSPISHQSVSAAIVGRLPVTFELTVLSIALALVIAVVFAVISASRPGGLLDKVFNTNSAVLLAVPTFVAGPVLIYIFALQLGWFPVLGWVPLSEGIAANLRTAALPIIAMALNEIASFHRLLRADLITTLHEDYIDAARARGMSPAFVMFRHALRPASLSLVTIVGLNIGRALGGAVIIESMFSLPGLGQLMVESIITRDVIMLQGTVAFIALAYVLVNMLVDVSYGVLDPRARRKAWA